MGFLGFLIGFFKVLNSNDKKWQRGRGLKYNWFSGDVNFEGSLNYNFYDLFFLWAIVREKKCETGYTVFVILYYMWFYSELDIIAHVITKLRTDLWWIF